MFEIILNHPHIEREKSLKTCDSIGELIENIFPLRGDYFTIKWNDISVSLSYKYDLSVIFEDFVYLFKFLESNENILQVTFPSNTFNVVWDIKKDEDNIDIVSIWNSVLNHNEQILNSNSFLKININLFISELSKILCFIYRIFIDRKNVINGNLIDDILEDKPVSLSLY